MNTPGGSTAGFVYQTFQTQCQFVYGLSAPSPSDPAWSAIPGGTILVSALLIATFPVVPLAGQIASSTTLAGTLAMSGPIPLAGQIASSTTLAGAISGGGNCTLAQSSTHSLFGGHSMAMTAP